MNRRPDPRRLAGWKLAAWLTTVLLAFPFIPVAAQPAALPGGLGSVPPELIEQFRSMSPAEQRRLAARYGIDPSTLLGGAAPPRAQVGEPGEPIQPATPFRRGYEDPFAFEQPEERREDSDRIEPLDPSRRFGLDLFSSDVSTFAPVDNAPVPPDYRLGPGDLLQVMLIGKENEQLQLLVGRDGAIDFPELGKITLAGMALDDALGLLRSRVEAQLIGVDAIISLGSLRAINVFLAGEVRVPGNRSLSALSRVSHALYAGGGLTEIGSLRRITVSRGGEVVGRFDAYDLLLRGDASGDVQLQDGDVVFVPPVADMASVSGEVRRPAVYEIERETTIEDLLFMAGGTTARAVRRRALLERQAADALPLILTVSLDERTRGSTPVMRGDRLRVLSNSDRFENRISLEGAVQRPGVYGYTEGMRVSDIVSSIESDLAENVDYDYSLIVSEDAQSGRVFVRPFSIRAVMAGVGTGEDPELRPRDQLLFFNNVASAVGEARARERERSLLDSDFPTESPNDLRRPSDRMDQRTAMREQPASIRNDQTRTGSRRDGREDLGMLPQATDRFGAEFDVLQRERRDAEQEELEPNRQRLLAPVIARLEAQASPEDPVRIVSVSGAVHAEGDYPLSPGDTVAELVAAAGGLRDDAFTREVELQRVVTDADGSAVVRNIPLNLAELGKRGLEFQLESRDHLFVRGIPDWRPRDTVTVEGEVRFPGTYLIGPGETFGDLLKRAGGLTQQAFAEGIVFTREGLREQEARETRRFIGELRSNVAAAVLTQEDVQVVDFSGLDQFAESLIQSENLGRLIVDVPRILVGDDSADVILQAGDAIEVPAQVNTVTVIGEVQRPGSYRFQERYDVRDYLATSAGTTRRADERRMYILRANGEINPIEGRRMLSFSLADASVQPGDTIVVPIDTSYRNTLDYWSAIVQIAYQGGIALAALLAI